MDNAGHYDEYPELTRADAERERVNSANQPVLNDNHGHKPGCDFYHHACDCKVVTPNRPEAGKTMNKSQIDALVTKLRKLVPAQGEWTTLAQSACGDASDALEVLSASKVAVPKGWKLVPVEPTEEMVLAGWKETKQWSATEEDARLSYIASVAASHAAPSPAPHWHGSHAPTPEVVITTTADAPSPAQDERGVLPNPDTTYSAPWAGHTFKYHSLDQIVEYANARVRAALQAAPAAEGEPDMLPPLKDSQRSHATSLYMSLPHNMDSAEAVITKVSADAYVNGFQAGKYCAAPQPAADAPGMAEPVAAYCPSQFGKQPHAFSHQKCGYCGIAAPQPSPTAVVLDDERAAFQSIIDAGRSAKPKHMGGIGENTIYLTPDMYAALSQAPISAFESALAELVNKIDTGLDSGDLLADAQRASSAIDSILSGGDLVASAHEYFRDSGDRYEKSVEFHIGWNACLDAIGAARAASPQQVEQTRALTREAVQQKAIDHGFKYWRAPDAHGVTATNAQAVDLLQDLLGFEVEIEAQTERALTVEQRDAIEAAQQVLRQIEAGDGLFVKQCSEAIDGLDAILTAAQPASGDPK